MTEADLMQQTSDLMELTVEGIGVVFSIVSAYIVALYYFLHRAPAVMKLGGFLFFSLIVGLLVIFTAGAFDHAAAIHSALAELAAKGALSPVGMAALARGGVAGGVDAALKMIIWICFALVYLALSYLTFFSRWRSDQSVGRD
jgi:hypothetical protein